MPAMSAGAVVTVTGAIAPEDLGVTDAHDHLFLRSPALPGQEFDRLEAAVEELREAQAGGLGAVVELTPIGCGRRPDLLRIASEATGVPIVGATGYHRDAHYPPDHWVQRASEELLADRVIADLADGMHPADWLDPAAPRDPARAGVIKGGASYHRISPAEHRRLVACAAGSRATGAAVVVHAEVGTAADEIVDLLEREGVAAERIALAHLDRNPDAELHAELAARGVTLEYDTIGRTKYHPDSVVLDLIEAVATAGHLERIVLGMDLGRRDYLRAYGGGPGLRYLMERFVPRLRRRLGAEATDAILVRNPARLFALAPVGATVA
jgi:phosphotriesterase-related protein